MEEVDSSLHVTKASSDACPTEDAIRALLENLVDPLLPPKPSPNDVPSKALRESVAKQVHAVVLLYNYYHRRDHPDLECLPFESFRSLTTVMRPALLPHFKESGEDGVLEKVMLDACSLSMSLGASTTDFSSLKKLPIRKVAVLLVDSRKTCCYLQHSSITQGVWSLLEKTIEREKSPAAGGHNEEVIFQKVAFAAIEEATGINHKDVVILERHLVQSLSEEKTTAQFYIMKCTSQDKFSGEFPVEEALNCMQGPLFEKSFSEWSTNSTVEYFHVLPYATLIADWFSRREDAEFVIEKGAEAVCDEIESNGKADESDVCPREDAIRALLENLVDPLLPLKPSPTDVPSKAVRESVAKQVRAVVVLYNYYYRREHPHLECLSFESFRSLTTVMRPALLPYFKESGEAGVSEQQTVLLEKVIADACSLSMSLDASSDFSSLKKWPIKKVAVLLVDSKKIRCYLQHSSVTQGVWSLLEKTIEKEKAAAAKGQSEEAIFQKVAFAAIEEATGINHKDVVILERHLVHSLSEEKTMAKFYIMKCTSEDKFSGEFPLEEALNCMQGPLFEKSSSEWSTNSIVEYFHVLPYASLVTDWFSRRDEAEFVIEKEAEAVCDEIETKRKADDSSTCPTEDAIRALLENLVDPLLPHKPSPTDVPSKAVRESVAKQVHAVVLLYNYYHRRDHPHLEFLSFESFRSLTTVMRPALLPHFKESGDGVVLLEKVIVDACSLSMSLDASSDFSSLKKWPIKKVAVLLIDSKKTTCYLQHSSITQGVWSLLEKTIEREKIAAKGLNEEAIFQKVAFAAIKEATGINHKDVVILERHLVHSLSEEKTTTKFYIMKCTSQDNFPGEFPIEEALNCMQGPLFEKGFSEWSTDFAVEYFHVLPYASLITDWFSRRKDSEFVIEKEAEALCESNGRADEFDTFDTPGKGDNATNARKDAAASRSSPKARKKVAPKTYSRVLRGRTVPAVEPSSQVETVVALKANNADSEMSPCKDNGERGGLEVGSGSNYQREKKTVFDKLKSMLKLNSSPVSAHDSNLNLEELQATLLSRASSLSETALRVLHCKRDKLTLQQREIEDEIAECDKRIKNVKGNWELQLETILESCNEANQRRIIQESHDKSACQSNKRQKLCEPLPSTNSMCQKLDDLCLENNWVLPNYRVSSTDGGYEAEVRIKETHFAHTICGDEKSDAEEARNLQRLVC
ncbi:hypothetical protein Bca52824_079568 [Brassica carinata]|uniref:Uncharacterized protein n=1 Tax=Brassica carinata TaxID=52824 RepID=A0A8X7Q3A2_BRACI|nr:hypothetical protein Bca52824_079568 [Brassica carinata]